MTIGKHINQLLSYLVIGIAMLVALFSLPPQGGYVWHPWVINTTLTLLFVLLVWLTARLARTDTTFLGILLTGLFLLLFCPGGEKFFVRDDQGIVDLSSQCMVPFFLSQYTRLRRRDFHYWNFLMLLMGIFCSFTHNGVTIPLCLAFVWLSFRHLKGFFRMACWPMVIGFVIGTTVSIFAHNPSPDITAMTNLPATMSTLSDNTWTILRTLWDTKVFVLSLLVTLYFLYGPNGRQLLRRIARRHYAICVCAAFSFLTMPLAPLGIDNAVHGVCFFCMFWLLFIVKYVAEKYLSKRI